MREILYIQAGPVSNYTGTHYWNTQESYFTYDESDLPLTDYSISFKEGQDSHHNPTLYPRLLIFDHKSNFGPLTQNRNIGEDLHPVSSWQGAVQRQEQERISRSEYHALLETEDDSDAIDPDQYHDTKVRYWSDYSRVFFDSKSMQRIPDAPDMLEGDWATNHELFKRYDENTELMDGPLRLLIEECDNFQGVQMMNDTATFGGFSHALLRSFRDEYRKATVMAFSVLSDIMPLSAEIGYVPHTRKIINDGLCLQGLSELCDLAIPILAPSHWRQPSGTFNFTIDRKNLYRSSAVLSAIAESATLPLRLRGGLDDLQSYTTHLNWRKSSPFAQLNGNLFPGSAVRKDEIQAAPQLSLHSQEEFVPYARRDVSRGFETEDLRVYKSFTETNGLKHPFLISHNMPAYPIPTSFPSIFSVPRPRSVKLFSSIMTSPSLAIPLSQYVTFVEDTARRRDAALTTMGLEYDDMRELASTLWEIVDGYNGAEVRGEGNEMELGEDEE
ncbi:Misato segment II tubulin-like domain-containing protein [Scleroderma yunnanense]